MSHSATPAAAPLDAAECVTLIQAALKQFGEYSYHDKGAHEVMHLAPLIARFRAMGGAATGAVLVTVMRLLPDTGEGFASAIISSLDDLPDAEFDALIGADPALAELY